MLDPQAKALLDLIAERGMPPTHMLSVPEARRVYVERRGVTQPAPPEVGECRDLVAATAQGEVPLRLYRPQGIGGVDMAHLLPALVYFHGGGWVIGDLDTHDTVCRQLANAAGCVVVSVQYRLGPEHRFPAAVDDSFGATQWIAANAASLGIDAARIAVGGDSAGGNLAAVVSLMARDAGGPPIAYQLLVYPATDMTAPHSDRGDNTLLTSDTMAYFHDHYIDGAHTHDWRASPMRHPDLTRLPPALVLTAGNDPLHDQGAAYAQRLSESGNRCSYVCFDRAIHGFLLMGRVMDEGNTAVALCAAELRRAFGAGAR